MWAFRLMAQNNANCGRGYDEHNNPISERDRDCQRGIDPEYALASPGYGDSIPDDVIEGHGDGFK